MNNKKLKTYLNQLAVIYEGTTSFESGAAGRIIDFDATSKGELSLFILPMEFDNLDGIARLNNGRWVKQSNIKQLISFKKPNKFILFLKKLMFWRL
jgi:hypothetical protein